MSIKKSILFSLVSFLSFSQSYFLEVGANETEYNYTNENNVSLETLEASTGLSFKVGMSDLFFETDEISHSIGASIQSFNATGGRGTGMDGTGLTQVDSYEWNTTFVGIFNELSIPIINKGISVAINSGIDLSVLLDGKQKISNAIFDLNESDDFKGIFQTSKVGLSIKINESIEFGYSIMYSSGLKNIGKGDDAFNMKTNQVSLKIIK